MNIDFVAAAEAEAPATHGLADQQQQFVVAFLQRQEQVVVIADDAQERAVARLVDGVARIEGPAVQEDGDDVAVAEVHVQQRVALRRQAGPCQDAVPGPRFPRIVPGNIDQPVAVGGHRLPGRDRDVLPRVAGEVDPDGVERLGDLPDRNQAGHRLARGRRRKPQAIDRFVAQVGKEGRAIRGADQADGPGALAVGQVVDDQDRIGAFIPEHLGLAAGDHDLQVVPALGQDLQSGGEPGAIVQLPAVHAVEDGAVLQRVVVEGGAMRTDVDPLVVSGVLDPEQQSGVGSRPRGGGDVHLDDAILQADVLEEGAPGQGFPPEVVNDLRAAQVPALGVEFRPRGKAGLQSQDQKPGDDGHSQAFHSYLLCNGCLFQGAALKKSPSTISSVAPWAVRDRCELASSEAT
jgi:hypothetical protein